MTDQHFRQLTIAKEVPEVRQQPRIDPSEDLHRPEVDKRPGWSCFLGIRATYLCQHTPAGSLCHLLLVQASHPSGPSIWTNGTEYLVSRGGLELFFYLFSFLPVPQEMISTKIVAFCTSPSYSFILFST